jgi:hypothetical protein
MKKSCSDSLSSKQKTQLSPGSIKLQSSIRDFTARKRPSKRPSLQKKLTYNRFAPLDPEDGEDEKKQSDLSASTNIIDNTTIASTGSSLDDNNPSFDLNSTSDFPRGAFTISHNKRRKPLSSH